MPTTHPPTPTPLSRIRALARPQAAPATAIAAAPTAARAAVIDALADAAGLWPPLPCHPCACCALPRRAAEARGQAYCLRCRQLRARYGDALAGVVALALTTRDWSLGAALRRFKDEDGASPDAAGAHELGAVLSAALEARLRRPLSGLPPAPDVIGAVPSSRPVIAAALQRAARERWWTPPLAPLAQTRPGLPRQRERAAHERLRIDGKWDVDAAAVAGHEILLLDDVATTGATLHSLARALADAGATRVRALVLARNVGDAGAWILPALQARHAAGVRWSPAPTLRERCGR